MIPLRGRAWRQPRPRGPPRPVWTRKKSKIRDLHAYPEEPQPSHGSQSCSVGRVKRAGEIRAESRGVQGFSSNRPRPPAEGTMPTCPHCKKIERVEAQKKGRGRQWRWSLPPLFVACGFTAQEVAAIYPSDVACRPRGVSREGLAANGRCMKGRCRNGTAREANPPMLVLQGTGRRQAGIKSRRPTTFAVGGSRR